jgi:hypothetical protein
VPSTAEYDRAITELDDAEFALAEVAS